MTLEPAGCPAYRLLDSRAGSVRAGFDWGLPNVGDVGRLRAHPRARAWLLGDNEFTGGFVGVALGSTTPAQVQAGMRAAGWRVDAEPGLAVSARKGKVSALLYPERDTVTSSWCGPGRARCGRSNRP
jgi:hypothetical protein